MQKSENKYHSYKILQAHRNIAISPNITDIVLQNITDILYYRRVAQSRTRFPLAQPGKVTLYPLYTIVLIHTWEGNPIKYAPDKLKPDDWTNWMRNRAKLFWDLLSGCLSLYFAVKVLLNFSRILIARKLLWKLCQNPALLFVHSLQSFLSL